MGEVGRDHSTYLPSVPFAIEETSGIVSVVSPLRNYSRSSYEFEAVVTDGRDSLATNLTIHVAPTRRAGSRRDIVLYFSIQVCWATPFSRRSNYL